MPAPIAINRQSKIPIYLQLKQGLERLVETGIWDVGYQLPPERELAEDLGISRNTVSSAYRALVREKKLVSRQGSGTFVAQEADSAGSRDDDELLKRVVDLAIDHGLELGFSLDEFLNVCEERALTKKSVLQRLKVAFIECNREQLDYFTRELELGSGVAIVPLFFSDLEQWIGGSPERLQDIDLVVTTFFHLDDVKVALSGFSVDILGIALDPDVGTMVRLARMPDHLRLGLVCMSTRFAERVEKSIVGAGILFKELKVCTSGCGQELSRFLQGVDAVIASPGRMKEVERQLQADRGVEVIEFIYKPDAGSVNLLQSALLELKQQD